MQLDDLAVHPLQNIREPRVPPQVQLEVVLGVGHEHPRLVSGRHGLQCLLGHTRSARDVASAMQHNHCTHITRLGCATHLRAEAGQQQEP